MKNTTQQIWFITGISRGLGLELARTILSKGGTVIGTTRSGESPLAATTGKLHVLPLEVTDAAQAETTVATAFSLYGHIDVIVNNAGYGLLGAVEESSLQEARHVMDVNFFGPLMVIQAALPRLRAQGAGHIVNISSIAGLAPAAGSGLYAAAKFALEGMSQSLAQEVAPLGIKVTLVEPGAFRTDFLSAHSVRRASATIPEYDATAGMAVRYLDQIAGRQLGNPASGAVAILETINADEPPLHLVLGTDALRRVRVNLDRFTTDLAHWEKVTVELAA